MGAAVEGADDATHAPGLQARRLSTARPRVMMRLAMPELSWIPIWVILPVRLAASVTCRASNRLCVSGFWQYTCLPRFRALMVIGACM